MPLTSEHLTFARQTETKNTTFGEYQIVSLLSSTTYYIHYFVDNTNETDFHISFRFYKQK